MINTEEAIKWLTLQKNKGIQWDTGPTEDVLMKAIIESRIRESYDIAIEALSERKTGKWIYDYLSADGHRVYHCSECGCYLKPKHSEPLETFKYCNYCGTKMIKEEK